MQVKQNKEEKGQLRRKSQGSGVIGVKRGVKRNGQRTKGRL